MTYRVWYPGWRIHNSVRIPGFMFLGLAFTLNQAWVFGCRPHRHVSCVHLGFFTVTWFSREWRAFARGEGPLPE